MTIQTDLSTTRSSQQEIRRLQDPDTGEMVEVYVTPGIRADTDELSLVEVASQIWRWKWWIFLPAVVGMTLAMLLATFQGKQFEITVSIGGTLEQGGILVPWQELPDIMVEVRSDLLESVREDLGVPGWSPDFEIAEDDNQLVISAIAPLDHSEPIKTLLQTTAATVVAAHERQRTSLISRLQADLADGRKAMVDIDVQLVALAQNNELPEAETLRLSAHLRAARAAYLAPIMDLQSRLDAMVPSRALGKPAPVASKRGNLRFLISGAAYGGMLGILLAWLRYSLATNALRRRTKSHRD